MIKNRTAIVGLGQTEYVRTIGRSELETAHEVSLSALADAGLSPQEVDGIFYVEGQSGGATDLARRLGVDQLSAWAGVAGGGGAACGPVVHAATAVASGLCEVAIAYRARNRGVVGGRPWAKTEAAIEGWNAFQAPYGLVNPVQTIAFTARRYLHEFGAPEECFARVSVAQRRYASQNPAAYFREPISVEDVLSSRMISDPLHLLECCPENDGACAVVVTSAERARDCAQPPVRIRGVAQGVPSEHVPMTNMYRDDPWTWPGDVAASKLYAMADITPQDVDVVQMYDMFSPVVLYGLESYGFCGRGEAGDFVCDGHIDSVDASLPTNTSGGSLSEAYIHGFNLILEGVRQIRGTSSNQVHDAEVALVAAASIVPTSAIVLGR